MERDSIDQVGSDTSANLTANYMEPMACASAIALDIGKILWTREKKGRERQIANGRVRRTEVQEPRDALQRSRRSPINNAFIKNTDIFIIQYHLDQAV
jgi:hypothetical protein